MKAHVVTGYDGRRWLLFDDWSRVIELAPTDPPKKAKRK